MVSVVIRNALDAVHNPTVTWTQQSVPSGATMPYWVHYHSVRYDPASQQVIVWAIPQSQGGIYATTMYAYATGTNTWTRLGGSNGEDCTDGDTSDVQPWPNKRHPIQQNAIDTTRNRYWQYSGTCTTTGVHNDLWGYALNATPTQNTWTNVGMGAVTPAVTMEGGMTYSPDDDVLLLAGSKSPTGQWGLYVYGPTTGSLTAAQLAAGAVNPNEWASLAPSGMPASANSFYPTLIYDPFRDTVMVFANGYYPSTYGVIAVHEYTVPTQTWTVLSPSGMPTESAGDAPEQPIALITTGPWAGLYVYHRTSHTSASAITPQDFLYHPTQQAFTPLTSVGSGPARLVYMTWDATANRLVAWSYATGPALEIWHGVLS